MSDKIKKLNAVADEVTEINASLLSKNGYYIFDLMVPAKAEDAAGRPMSGYITSSGFCFYSEDEKLRKEFLAILDTMDNTKIGNVLEFLKAHPETIKAIAEVPTMNSREMLAFNHLIDEASRKQTLSKAYYGAAHLVEDDKILVFHQNTPPLNALFKEGGSLLDEMNLCRAQKQLRQLWKDGKVKEEVAFEGKAFERLKQSLRGNGMHDELFNLKEIIHDFAQEFDVPVTVKSVAKNKVQVNFHDNSFNLSASGKEGKVLFEDTKEISYAQVIEGLYNMTYGNKIANFMSRKSLKI